VRTKIFLLTALFALIFSHPAFAPEKLRVGFSVIGVASSPSWVAVEKGLWKKYGLDVELILLSGGTRSVPALVSGNVQILIGSDISVIQAIAQGIDLTRLGVTNNFVRASLVTQPSIQSIR
jgi:NitT/TauT family transport system substrate-binding protein